MQRDELASARVELRAGVDNGSALTALQAEVKSREMEGLQAALRVKEVEMEKADLMRQMKASMV